MISKEEVEKVGKLARLELESEELEALTKDMNAILGYVEQLNELDLSSVEPLENINEHVEENALREDVSRPSLPVMEALRNAPKAADNYFLVPKVLQQEVKSFVERDIAGAAEEELDD